jgi:predicted amidohydrolase YtcJ
MQSKKNLAIKGNIYTGNKNFERAEIVLIDEGVISYVGKYSDEMTENYQNVIYLKENEIVTPGFIDSHIHPILACCYMLGSQLSNCQNVFDIQQGLKDYQEKFPDKDWVHGYGYVLSMFPDNTPHKKYLDEVCPDKPVILLRFDAHSHLYNSKALEILCINKFTPDPSGGKIVKDSNGEVTGEILEGELVIPYIQNFTEKDFKDALLKGISLLVSEGITCFMDAWVISQFFTAYREVYNEFPEKLPRVSLAVLLKDAIQILKDNKDSMHEILKLPTNDKIKANTIKIIVDGVTESKTALLFGSYCCECHTHGMQMLSDQEITDLVSSFHERGIQCHFHTIGDKAVHIALNSVESAQKKFKDIQNLRHYTAHNQLIDYKDLKRFSELNCGANFSPFWFHFDANGKINQELLGEDRASSQYPIVDLMNSNGLVCFGSDWPVSTFRPLDGIQIAVTRKPLNLDSEEFGKNQKITIEEAFKAYTFNSAYMLHRDDQIGSIEVGKFADLIILDQDIFRCPSKEIHQAKVLCTIVNGDILFNKMES